MSLLAKCHIFRNPIITAGECSLFWLFYMVLTGNSYIHSCIHKLHIDVVLQMCTQMLLAGVHTDGV